MVSYKGHCRGDGEGTTRLLWLSKKGNNVTQKIPTSLWNGRLSISIDTFVLSIEADPVFWAGQRVLSFLHCVLWSSPRCSTVWQASFTTFQGYCYSSCPSPPLLKEKTSKLASPHRHISTANDFDSFLQQRGMRESTILSNLKATP